MNYRGLQIGNRKAKKRTSRWIKYSAYPELAIGKHRKTTKLCSVAIHGCGHRRDLEGPPYQERRDTQDKITINSDQ